MTADRCLSLFLSDVFQRLARHKHRIRAHQYRYHQALELIQPGKRIPVPIGLVGLLKCLEDFHDFQADGGHALDQDQLQRFVRAVLRIQAKIPDGGLSQYRDGMPIGN